MECTGTPVCVKIPLQRIASSRCLLNTVEISHSLPFPTGTSDNENPIKNCEGERPCNCNPTLLATKAMVPTAPAGGCSSPNMAAAEEGPPTAGPMVSPQPRQIATDSMAVESARLQSQGISEELISTLLSRRATTNATFGENLQHSLYNKNLPHCP